VLPVACSQLVEKTLATRVLNSLERRTINPTLPPRFQRIEIGLAAPPNPLNEKGAEAVKDGLEH